MDDSARSSLISSACTCRSTSAIFSISDGSSLSSRSERTPRLEAGTSAMPSRSLASRNLAQVQPSFSLPIRLATGTLARRRRTRRSPHGAPSSMMIGRTVTPGVFMSISRKEMPSCGLASVSVRTRQKIQSRPMGERGPGLLAVDDVVVAVTTARRAQVGEVGAGARLRVALAPLTRRSCGCRAGSAPSARRCRRCRSPARPS